MLSMELLFGLVLYDWWKIASLRNNVSSDEMSQVEEISKVEDIVHVRDRSSHLTYWLYLTQLVLVIFSAN